MDAAFSRVDEVSTLAQAPAVGRRELFAGARPVVGAIAACSLLVLVCSWFAIGDGSLWPTRDVGNPQPVRIDGTPRADTVVETGAVRTGRRPPHRGAQANTFSTERKELRSREPGTRPGVSSRIDPERASTQPPEQTSPPPATEATAHPSPSVPPRSDPPPVNVETPPLGGLPGVPVPVPPVAGPTLPVTPPALPNVPAVTDLTSSVGLP